MVALNEGKKVEWRNLAIGAAIQIFEVSTLGQPFEVVKTHMAANRSDSLLTAARKTFQRGGIFGYYQGLVPWAWIEASTKGAVLLFSASEIDRILRNRFDMSTSAAGILSGMGGGIAQAYTTMGFCTFMKTVEVTRHKQAGQRGPSTFAVAYDVLKREGIVGINKGVSAVALRQMTNWGSRIGIARIVESVFRGSGNDKERKLSNFERICASAVGGALGCWNQPIEVIRVEMQSQTVAADRPARMTIWTTAKYIYQKQGLRGFYRGITPRVGLGVWQTICVVFGGDQLKQAFATAKP